MAEPTVSDKKPSFEQKVHQAFLKAVDVITTSAKEVIAKVKEAQANDCSTSVELQSHKVESGYAHVSIRLTPKGAKYKDDPRFKHVDRLGRPYTNVGAGREYSALISNLDRPKDGGLYLDRINIGPKDCKEESIVIETLLDRDKKNNEWVNKYFFPERLEDLDCSTSIELQSHEVALGYSHTSIRITPMKITPNGKDLINGSGHLFQSKRYESNSYLSRILKQVDELGRRYITIGAGPEYNTLVSDLDRPKDIGPHPNRIPIGPKDCKEALVVIETLLDLDQRYKDHLDYDVKPKKEPEQRSWAWADDGHNSNSYISGLIDAAGLKKPSIDTETHPGWDNPVPIESFGDYNGHYISKDYEEMPLPPSEEEESKRRIILLKNQPNFDFTTIIHDREQRQQEEDRLKSAIEEKIKNFPKSEAFKKIKEQVDNVKNIFPKL